MSVNFPILFNSGKHTFLVLDPSSSHLAYAIITLDFTNKVVELHNSGMVWVKDSWSKGKKYRYMIQAIKILAENTNDGIPQHILTEAFFANPKQMMGSAVVPTINSFANMVADELKLGFHELGPTSWRSILGIKPTKGSDGKRDYKVPTANLVKQFLTLPSEVPSNITRKMRTMPNDVTDVLAIALALGKHHGINKATQANTAFYPFTLIEKLNKLSEEI